MVMTLILTSSKLVNILKNADLSWIFAMQLYWNHTSSWVMSSKFAAFLQNTSSEEYLWRAAFGHLYYNIYTTTYLYWAYFPFYSLL